MALDFKIEFFAYKVFLSHWKQYEQFEYECDLDEVYENELDQSSDPDRCYLYDRRYNVAVDIMAIMYHNLHYESIRTTYNEFSCCLSDFQNYVSVQCGREDWFGYFTIFDRIFATCAFVINLCNYCFKNQTYRSETLLKHGHVCWAMYFDRFGDEFYSQGGWKQLRKVASTYTKPYQVIDKYVFLLDQEVTNFSFLPELLQSTTHFCNFLKEVRYDAHKTLTKQWVKFLLRKPPRQYQSLKCLPSGFEMANLITKLKRFFDPGSKEVRKNEIEESALRDRKLIREFKEVFKDEFEATRLKNRKSDEIEETTVRDCKLIREFKEVSKDEFEETRLKIRESDEDLKDEIEENTVCYCKLIPKSDERPFADSNSPNPISHLAEQSGDILSPAAFLGGSTDSREHDPLCEEMTKELKRALSMKISEDSSEDEITLPLEENEMNDSKSTSTRTKQETSDDISKKGKEESKKERESNSVRDLLRMIFVLGDREGIRNVRATLHGSKKARNL
ncbi:uncharacterized protein CDAR_421761 [Caerostris darwini]|uniref:Uncharacterized protein n=1 Tax=Caerostris darwini TaxID=1538125 RepID=A0AAV4VBI5_9ARAC|nr:uncharacterized protein CDAR_421761 [Caerostris darwini]